MDKNKELMKAVNEELIYLKDKINKYGWNSIKNLPKIGEIDGSYLCRIEDKNRYFEYRILDYKISEKRFYSHFLVFTFKSKFKDKCGTDWKLTNWKRIELAKTK